MTRLAWDSVGERIFEAGVDRGVLYVDGSYGVPWNGLVSVTESPSGGEVSSYYIDGIKYLDFAASEEFGATIEAFTYPTEFEECQGIVSTVNGLQVTHQRKKTFSFSYRSFIGNDIESIDYAYKIHLVYNAFVEPSEVAHNTLSDSVDPDNFSWKVVTKPQTFSGYKPTAHFIIDSRKTGADLLAFLEDIIYGNATQEARMPSSDELIYIFATYASDIIDGGSTIEPQYSLFDAGNLYTVETVSVDGGGP